MDVVLTHPINITLSSALLVLENKEDAIGVIEFKIFDQPCRLILTYGSYHYDTNLQIGDRVRLIQNYSNLTIGSEGYLRAININYLQDNATVDFCLINPDQSILRNDSKVLGTDIYISYDIPISYLEKV